MKKFYMSLFIAALCNQVSYAYNYSKNLIDDSPFFCPPQIVYLSTFDYGYSNDYWKYRKTWGDFINAENIITNKSIQTIPNWPVAMPHFKFTGVDAPYYTPGYPICNYQLQDDPTFTLSFFRKEVTYQAFSSNTSNWIINAEGAKCVATDPTQCPLTNTGSIAIHNIDISHGIVFSTNGRQIAEVPASNWGYILYHDAINACGIVAGTCVVDVIIDGFKVGSIDVNMKELGMQIESMYSMLKQYSIKQIQNGTKFNAIEISNTKDQLTQGH